MKKHINVLSVIMIFTILVSLISITVNASTIVNGVCGNNLTWNIDENGVFTLHGDGEMISFESGFDVPWRRYLSTIKKIVFDGSPTNISAYAFSGCAASGDLIIPDSVIRIDGQAFYGCSNLNGKLHISNSCEYIGHYAFMNCYNLKGDLVIPNSVKTIEKQAFYWCSGFDGKLVLSNNLLNIPEQAFTQCNNVSGDLIIPNSVLSIGKNAFAYCEKLSGKIVLSENLITIGENAFIGCKKLTGDLIIPEKVTSIGASAFADCSSLSGELKLLGSMTKISQKVFFNCIGLKGDLIIPNTVTEIGEDAFNSCIGFSGKIILSDSLQTIGESAFAGCRNLTGDLIIPGKIKTIGKEAFWGCTNLKGTLKIPVSVEKIEYGAFYDVNFKHLIYDGTELEWQTITIESYNSDLKYIQYCHFNYNAETDIKENLVVPGTCKVVGIKEIECSCGYKFSDYSAYGDHKYLSKVTRIATCKINGVKTYTCEYDSNHTYTEDIGVNASNHVNTKNVADVNATCTTKGYTAGTYCNDCKKYISGHKEIAKNPSNHVNTKKVAAVAATTEKVGYTAGVYCNDCQKYISGHSEIPKIVPSFNDSSDAKVNGNDVVSNTGLTVAQLLSQAGKGAVITTAQGTAVTDEDLIGTGMVLTLADGTKKEIVVYGDADGDGKISASDARLALRASVGLESYKEDSCYYKAANVESNDKMSASDARLILRASVGLEEPKEWLVK